MKKLVKQLVSESAIYGISSMLSRFIGIFLVPLYTKILSPSDYGSLNLVNASFYFVAVLAVFALDNASARWYYDTENPEDRKKTISSWFWFQLSTSLILCVAIILFSSFLSHTILKENKSNLFIIPAVGLLTSILPGIATNWLRFQRKAIHTVIFTICNILINVGLNIWFVLILKWGVSGILSALVISNAIATLYVLTLMYPWIYPSYFSIQRIKEMLRFALPLLPTAVAFWILNSSSSFMIEHFHGKTEVGLYAIGSMVASAVTMVAGAFQMAWGPFAFSIIHKPEAKSTYSMVLSAYSLFMCSVALVVALFSKEALLVFTSPQFHSAYVVAGILAFNGIIYGYGYIGVMGCSIVKNNNPLALSILMAAAATATGYFLLVPFLGKEGAALSTAIGYLIVPVFLFYRSQQLWFIPYKFSFTLLIFFGSIITYIASLLLAVQHETGINIGIKVLLLTGYLFFLLVLVRKNYPEIYEKLAGILVAKKNQTVKEAP